MNEAIARRRSALSFMRKKVEAENVTPYSIVDINYLAEDADWEVVGLIDASRIHYNHY